MQEDQADQKNEAELVERLRELLAELEPSENKFQQTEAAVRIKLHKEWHSDVPDGQNEEDAEVSPPDGSLKPGRSSVPSSGTLSGRERHRGGLFASYKRSPSCLRQFEHMGIMPSCRFSLLFMPLTTGTRKRIVKKDVICAMVGADNAGRSQRCSSKIATA